MTFRIIRWGRANNLKETTLEELLNEDVNTIDIACLLSTHDIEELKIPLRLVLVTIPWLPL